MRIFCISILLLWVLQVQAQYTKIHDFITENDLKFPRGELVTDGTWFYFVTEGAIFKMKPDGSGFTKLFDFNGNNGANAGGLTLSGSVLYGSTSAGGINNKGVLFSINTDGTGFKKLFEFNETNGWQPYSGLTVSGSILYGMTNRGGTMDYGVAFKINIDGTGYTKLLDFDGVNNGAHPGQKFAIAGTTLYGTTYEGGINNKGVIFRIETDGSGFSKLFDFNNTSGANPSTSLILTGTTLYGATLFEGPYIRGVVFKINTDGTGYTRIVDFDGGNGAYCYGLSVSGENIFGTTFRGGSQNRGVVFKININTNTYTKLFDFSGSNGQNPRSPVVQSGTKLFGSTSGDNDFGTIFSINDDGSDYSKLVDCSKALMGSYPDWSNFVSDGTWLYGTTGSGGLGYGTVYKIKPDGSSFTKLFDFDWFNGVTPNGLVLSGSVLYGTTKYGGASESGTIFKISTTGTGFTKILDFEGSSKGYMPNKLNLIGPTIYGSTSRGGTSNMGVIYKINIDGTGFTKLFDFDGLNYGGIPSSELVLSGTNLYGTTLNGGSNDKGVVFRIDINGTGFSKLVDFTGSNGSYPYSSLTMDGTTLFGTTSEGGSNNLGVIFKINTDGTNFSRIYNFDGVSNGAWPMGSLTLSNSKLFGITNWGGSNYGGILYRINTDGDKYTILHDFKDVSDGRRSNATPFIFGDALYAQTNNGGTTGSGTIFKYDLKPTVTGSISGPASILRGSVRSDLFCCFNF